MIEMKQPLFKVNEVVILQSKWHPECNGEYTIQEIRHGKFPDVLTKEHNEGFSYDLGFRAPAGHKWWRESALRKKHDGSSFSFGELLNNLKTQIQERVK